jgi:hypothetical protein
MTVARCHLRAIRESATTPRNNEAFRKALAGFPKVCPHNDCSPGTNCRKEATVFFVRAWEQRK